MGSALVGHLLDHGYRVRALDACLYGAQSLSEFVRQPGFEFLCADVRDMAAVESALEQIDAVVHLAALVGDPACDLDENLTREINLHATLELARRVRDRKISQFLFASSCSVYGSSDETLTEEAELLPISLYARTKVEAEQALQAEWNSSFAPVILRFATLYGLSPRPRFDLVVNLLAARASRNEPITLFGGRQWRPFLHVEDAARAIRLCLEAPAEALQETIFNVGSDTLNFSIDEIGDQIQEVFPAAVVNRNQTQQDARNYRVSFVRFRDRLGFAPAHTLPDGMREIQAAISAGQIGDYRDARYSNHQALVSGAMEKLTGTADPARFGLAPQHRPA